MPSSCAWFMIACASTGRLSGPKYIVPRHSLLTERPERPRGVYSMPPAVHAAPRAIDEDAGQGSRARQDQRPADPERTRDFAPPVMLLLCIASRSRVGGVPSRDGCRADRALNDNGRPPRAGTAVLLFLGRP